MVLERTIVFDENSDVEAYVSVPPEAQEAVFEIYSIGSNAITCEIWGTLEDDMMNGYSEQLSPIRIGTDDPDNSSNYEITATVTAEGIYSVGVSGMRYLYLYNGGTQGDLKVIVSLIG